MKLSEISRDKRILIQGGSGVGKTTIIGTLCKFIPTFDMRLQDIMMPGSEAAM